MPVPLDLIGETFGRLLVIKLLPLRRNGSVVWRCVCDCGNQIETVTQRLRNGQTQSCGCLHRESARARATRHGLHTSPEYMNWKAMRQRCLDPSHESYPYYGGRGIDICDRWYCFENFFADMGRRPFPGATIDRVDSEGDYEPSNCRWATRAEQTKNRKVNAVLSEADIDRIRELSTTLTQRRIAQIYGVAQSLICRVVQGERKVGE